jgi:hypothetical protein
MISPDPGSASSGPPDDAPPRDPPLIKELPARPRHPIWRWALPAGLLAGLISGIAGEKIYGAFDVTPEASSGTSQSPEFVARVNQVRLTSSQNEAATTFAVLGGTLGLALGLAGGLARRNFGAAILAACIGLVLGGACGAFAGRGMVPIFFRNEDPLSSDLVFPMLVHEAIWTPLGLVAGLAFGIGLGGWGRMVRATAGGMLGAICGTIVYELAGAVAFASDKSHYPVSASIGSRLLAHLVVALFIAAGAAACAREPKPRVTPGSRDRAEAVVPT